MIALPRQRRVETAAIAGALAFLLCASIPLLNPDAFGRALHGEGTTNLVNPFSLWWPLGSSIHLPSGALAPARLLPLGLSRAQSSVLALAVTLPVLGFAYARARRRGLPAIHWRCSPCWPSFAACAIRPTSSTTTYRF
jgi:hypothetical protein